MKKCSIAVFQLSVIFYIEAYFKHESKDVLLTIPIIQEKIPSYSGYCALRESPFIPYIKWWRSKGYSV